MMTTWMLRYKVSSCVEWKSTMVGQDIFTRTEPKDGPRRYDDTHTPQDVHPDGSRKRRAIMHIMQMEQESVVMRAKRDAGKCMQH